MNYIYHYNLLIAKAKSRTVLDHSYIEKHHIVPKCLGGNNKKDNIVILFPDEHYVAHQLLVKIYPNELKLVYALHMMTVENKFQGRSKNKEYKWIKERYSLACKNKKLTEEHKKKIGDGVRGKRKGKTYIEQYGIETAEKLCKLKSEQLTGRKIDATITEKQVATRIRNGNHRRTEKTRKQISESQKGKIIPEEQKTKISIALTGRKLAPEHSEKIRISNTGKKREIVYCPYCNTSGGKAAMIRWHFENCKYKENYEFIR